MSSFHRLSAILGFMLALGACASSTPSPQVSGSSVTGKESGGGFYVEEAFKGRLYVFGTEKAHQSFKETQQVPHIANTFIAAGPEGQTLVLEADPKATDLQDRLKRQYEARHGANLP